MKKNLLILAGFLALCYSCSNDETIASQATSDANAISFRAQNSRITRAADEHFNAANDKFAVTAFRTPQTSNAYFDNSTFSTTDGSTFTSENKYYWPSSVNLDFYAYAPLSSEVGGSGSAVVTRSAYNTFLVTPGTDVPNQPDFVYAVTKNWGKVDPDDSNGTAAADEPHYIDGTPAGVTINFRHAESKVAFKLSNSNPNLKITVGQVTIGNLRGTETFTWNGVTDGTTPVAAASANTDGQFTSGTLTYLNGTWTATSTQTSAYTVTMESDASYNVFNGNVAAKDLYSTTASAPNFDMILIPQALKIETTYNGTNTGENASTFEGAYITVQIKIQNSAANADEYIVGGAETYVTAMWPLTAITWLPGHKYTYTIDLANGGYYTKNQDASNDLDPILEGAEIKFVTVTVDDWADGEATSVTSPSL